MNKTEIEMNKEKQRIAIAESQGLTNFDKFMNQRFEWDYVFPDYLSDLNAMHEAVKHRRLQDRPEFLGEFARSLRRLTAGSDTLAISSSAAKRAEAYIRTIGKWEE